MWTKKSLTLLILNVRDSNLRHSTPHNRIAYKLRYLCLLLLKSKMSKNVRKKLNKLRFFKYYVKLCIVKKRYKKFKIRARTFVGNQIPCRLTYIKVNSSNIREEIDFQNQFSSNGSFCVHRTRNHKIKKLFAVLFYSNMSTFRHVTQITRETSQGANPCLY